jgi:hypothetical protein
VIGVDVGRAFISKCNTDKHESKLCRESDNDAKRNAGPEEASLVTPSWYRTAGRNCRCRHEIASLSSPSQTARSALGSALERRASISASHRSAVAGCRQRHRSDSARDLLNQADGTVNSSE